MSSEGISTLLKSLFSHIFLCDSSLFFILKEQRQIKNEKKKKKNVLKIINNDIKNADSFFTAI